MKSKKCLAKSQTYSLQNLFIIMKNIIKDHFNQIKNLAFINIYLQRVDYIFFF